VRAACARFAPLALGLLGALVVVSPVAGATLLAPSGALAALAVTGAAGAAGDAAGALLPVGPAGASDPFALAAVRRGRLRFRWMHAGLDVLEGHAMTIAGVLLPGHAGHLVELQRRGDGRWRTVAHSFTGSRGRFRLRYAPRQLSAQALRVLFPGDGGAAASARRLGLLSVFRLAGASWYGGGGSLACGGQLTGSTLGVANKTLPCGTLVTLRYGGHSIRVPVVDRGPYVAGRDFDLTEATKRALGFEGVGEVWSSR
jgi:hypothetical protein